MIENILILGTGLLGTSTGLALRSAGYEGAVFGWDKDSKQSQLALERNAIDAIAANQGEALTAARNAQVIVLATPVYAILDWMEQLSAVVGPEQLITDVGSTKAIITATGNRLFNQPGKAGFLPGHPMAGKEVGGASEADGDLFRGAVWIFTTDPWMTQLSLRNADEISKRAASLGIEWMALVKDFGCRILELEATRHDELLAYVSHLPQFLSTALSALLQAEFGDAPDLREVGGRALREMTRLGSSPYSMWRDVAMTNTEEIADAIQALEQRLAHLRENLRTPELRDEFELAKQFRKLP